MTVIAWDGKTLAADKQATNNGLKLVVTKIMKAEINGVKSLVAVAGDMAQALNVVNWLINGGEFPASQHSADDWQPIVIINRRGVFKYEQSPQPILYEGPYFSMGSGADVAMAAMHLGKAAEEAVELACALCASCGMGIDTLTLS